MMLNISGEASILIIIYDREKISDNFSNDGKEDDKNQINIQYFRGGQ